MSRHCEVQFYNKRMILSLTLVITLKMEAVYCPTGLRGFKNHNVTTHFLTSVKTSSFVLLVKIL
jgi:hypothetical protein